ncbi:hypothetical protein OUZ56_000099 [Daphnia magna]|uniref:Uncharacterized protein n=2 Tax=Daphnia magna TaxID=35525 RepID=A0ABQ9ZZF8_9CRUS|nr:hypothetical protein OUZ56_000099 [Daphnia magna]
MDSNHVIDIENFQELEANQPSAEKNKEVSHVTKRVCWTGKKDKAQLAIDESANELFMELMKDVYPILVDKLKKNVEAWKKVAEGMDAGNFTILGARKLVQE